MPPTAADTSRNSINSNDIRRNTKYDHLIPQTREILRHKLTTQAQYADTYYKFDFDRAMAEDYHVRRFLIKCSGSVDSAVASIIASFQWIKNNNLRELKESDFPIEAYLLGAIFLYQPDLGGRPTMYFRIKNHVVIKELTKLKVQLISYLALKADDLGGESGVAVINDMTDVSLSNLDLEMALSLTVIREHLPYSGAIIMAVELPFIARAAYNVVKYAFPSDVRQTMVTISKKDLVKYIDIQNIPRFLGGTCKVPYSGPSVVPPGSISSVEYARKFLKLTAERIEKIAKIHIPMIENAQKDSGWEWDENLNVIPIDTSNDLKCDQPVNDSSLALAVS